MTFSGGYRNGTLGEKRLIQTGCLFIEVFTSRCSIKSCFEKFGKFHREAPTLTFFLVKLKRKPLHLFSCQFYDVLQNYYSMEHRHLLVQSQQWKHQNNLRKLFKLTIKAPERRHKVIIKTIEDVTDVAMVYLLLDLNKFQTLSSFYIVDFARKNAS